MTGLNRRHIRLETDICINCAISFKDLRVQIYYFFRSLQQESNLQHSVYKTDALPIELQRPEPGEGLEPSNVGFADRYVSRFAIRAFAGAERFELPSAVLETAMLPLHHASTSRKV